MNFPPRSSGHYSNLQDKDQVPRPEVNHPLGMATRASLGFDEVYLIAVFSTFTDSTAEEIATMVRGVLPDARSVDAVLMDDVAALQDQCPEAYLVVLRGVQRLSRTSVAAQHAVKKVWSLRSLRAFEGLSAI